MAENKGRKRVLFVDDEPSIRLTLPPILEKAGFEVHVAESVADALFEINSFQFDALLTDLNIGEEGDGFLVASGMRHIQPNCTVFILTGYPAFETALQAIHSQVDEYMVKPVEIDSLVNALRQKLESPTGKPESKRISTLLKEKNAELEAAVTGAVKREAKSSNSSEELGGFLSTILKAAIEYMDQQGDKLKPEAVRAATQYGQWRARSGGPAANVARDFRIAQEAAYQLIQKNLSVTELLPLISDLKRLGIGLNMLMEQSLQSFGGPTKKTAPV
ncbi:MAG TPA: response regulator [Candidatus Acidoferrales bacterium]|jgi:DNA-binding response OmpR family regulator|nr:response regulator [Candidatus Acidoferrales bacterium]